MADTIVPRDIKYEFDRDEIRALGQELARRQQNLVDARGSRMASQKAMKAEEESIANDIGRLTQNVNNGWELRVVQCSVRLNDPKSGSKTLFRTDTGELLETLPMEGNDFRTAEAGA